MSLLFGGLVGKLEDSVEDGCCNGRKTLSRLTS